VRDDDERGRQAQRAAAPVGHLRDLQDEAAAAAQLLRGRCGCCCRRERRRRRRCGRRHLSFTPRAARAEES
jgi:hypothetical protein